MTKFISISLLLMLLTFINSGMYAQKLSAQFFSNSSYAIDANGKLYTWGSNSNGQLGIGSTTNKLTPNTVTFPTGVTKWTVVTGGFSHTLAIGNDGNLYSWGSNSNGQLGIGTTSSDSTAKKVAFPSGVTGWTAVTAGASHSLALGNNGNLYSWGLNVYGQLGVGTTTDDSTAQKVSFPSGVTGWTAVAGAWEHSLAIGNDGNLYAWGWNAFGQLGLNSATSQYTTPQKVAFPSGVTGWTAVTAGALHSLALGNNGILYSWGWNYNGQLGDGTNTYEIKPVTVTLPGGVTSWTVVATGYYHSLAIGNDGNLYTWGLNDHGQLGIGTTTDNSTAQKVSFPSGVTGWKAVAGGYYHSLAISNNNNVYAWGNNDNGQLGVNTVADTSKLPVQVRGIGGIGYLNLPVELTTFSATLNNSTVKLNWQTATEVNDYGFEVEREESVVNSQKSSSISWEKIGFVKGAGHSSSPKQYSFTDNNISFVTYSYRLKQLDDNGSYKYSNVIEVNVGQMPNGFVLNQNYPNPFNPSTQIQFGFNNNTRATLTVYNVLGEKVADLFNSLAQAGQLYNITFNGARLASGIYYYKLQGDNYTVVKKMLLMK